jgi:hypothetical protein
VAGRSISELLAAEPGLKALPWDALAARAPSAWVDALTVQDAPVRPGRRPPADRAGRRIWRLRVTVASYDRFTFAGPGFAVGAGLVGGRGTVDVTVRVDELPALPAGRTRPREWRVELRGDLSLVLHDEALVPLPPSRRAPLLPPGIRFPIPQLPGNLPDLLGSLRRLAPGEIEVPLGAAALLVRPGPRMTTGTPLDVRGRRVALGARGPVVELARLTPTFDGTALTVDLAGGRLAVARSHP